MSAHTPSCRESLLLIFCFTILTLLFIPIKTPLKYYDEGFAVFHAMLTLNGDIAHKDFWSIYPPGYNYVLAFIFNFFDYSLLGARLYDTIIRAIIIACTFLITSRSSSHAFAIVTSLITALLFASITFYSYVLFSALALGLISIIFTFKYFDNHNMKWLFLSGLTSGLCMLLRWDIGIYTCISMYLSIAFYNYLKHIDILKPIKLQILINISLSVPIYLYWGYSGSMSELWQQAFIFPITRLSEARWLPYPSFFSLLNFDSSSWQNFFESILFGIRFYAPLLIYSLSLIFYGFSILKKREKLRASYIYTFTMTIFGVLLFAQALSRYDELHVLPTTIIASIVALSLLHQSLLFFDKFYLRVLIIVLTTLIFIPYVSYSAWYITDTFKSHSPFKCHSNIARSSCVSIDTNQEMAVEYIQMHTNEEDAIYVGSKDHSLLYVNDIAFYFLANRISVTKHHDLFPGVASTPKIQRAIVSDIKSNNTEYIILLENFKSDEENLSSKKSKTNIIDSFIEANYKTVIEFGNYEIKKNINKL